MALSWLRNLLSRPSRAQRRNPTFRPRLEGLETRLAPATWDGGGATNNWSDRFNWVGDVAPTTGNTIVFPPTNVDPTSKNNVNDFNDNRAFASITFSGQGFTVTGQSIQILGGTITAGSGTNALNVDINYSTMTVSPTGTLTLGGALSGGNITKTGAGRAVLTHDNPNFTGLMTINAGAIVVGHSGALGAAGTAANGTVVNSGAINPARVELSGNGVNVGAESLTLGGFAAKLVNSTGSGNNSWAGPITFPGDGGATLRGITSLSGQLTLSGVISSSTDETGAPQIEIEGTGVTVFAGAAGNTHQGAIRVSGGNLVLQKTGGAQAVVGSLDVINSGTVRLGESDQISNTVPIRLQAGTLNLNGFNETVGTLNLDKATITTGTGTLTLGANVTQGIPLGAGGTSTISGNLSLGNTDRTFTVNPTGLPDDLVISAVIQGTAAANLIKEGTGRMVLSGANQYLGLTEVNAGRLAITNAQALGLPNPDNIFVFQDGTDVKSGATLELRGSGPGLALAEDIQIFDSGVGGRGGALRNESGNNTLTGTVAFRTGIGSDVTTVGVEGSSQLSVDGTTIGESGGTIVKVGTGRLVFTGSDTTSLANLGTFEIREGVVTARGDATVGSASADVFVFSGAALELEDRTDDFDQAEVHLNGSGTGINGALRLLNGTATITSHLFLDTSARIGVNGGAALTSTGVISGPTASEFRKMGGGNLILDAANNYVGSTVVAQGTLTVRQPAALGTTGGTTVVHPGSTLAVDRPITGINERVTLGIATIAGEATLAAVGLSSQSAEWAGPITLANSATVTVPDDASLRLAGTITSAAAVTLTKKGTGRLSLTGSVTNAALDGPVVVQDGTLGLDKPGGRVALDGNLTVGDGIGAAGSARVTMTNSEQINNAKTVTVQRDGIFNLSSENETIARLTLAGGTTTTGGGFLKVQTVESLSSADTATVNGNLIAPVSPISIVVADGAAATDLVINAIVSAPINRAGAGTLVLTANNPGNMQLNDGRTLVNGSQPATAVSVRGPTAASSALLGGTGTVGAISLVNGTVNPGAPGQTGILTGSFGLTASASTVGGARRMAFDLNGGLVAGVNFDQLNVVGTVNLGTNLTQLVVTPGAGFTANPGDAFVIVSNDGTSDLVTGTFIGLPENADLTINGQPFRISYRGVAGNDNDVVLFRKNNPSMLPGRAITPTVTEGGFATLTGTIGDPDVNDFFFLDVNWGDGTAMETYTFEPGEPREISLQHRYLNNPSGQISGTFPVTLAWRDQHGEGAGDVLSVRVNNANPTVDAGGDVTLPFGVPLSRTGSYADAGIPDTHTATVDYGDGSGAVILALLPDGTFELDHDYAEAGTYVVTVTVTDSEGGIGRDMFTVTV